MTDYSRDRAGLDNIISFVKTQIATVDSTLTIRELVNVDLQDVFHYIDDVVAGKSMAVIVVSQAGETQIGNITYNIDIVIVASNMVDISGAISAANAIGENIIKALDYQINGGVIYTYTKETSITPDKWSMANGIVMSFMAEDTGVTP